MAVRRSLIFLFSFLLALPYFSQTQTKDWNLQQCIEQALQTNLQLQQSKLSLDNSQLSLLQSKAELFPTLNGSAAHTYNYGQTIDPFTNKFATNQVLSQNFGLSSTLNLFTGLQNYNTIKQNQYTAMAGKFDLDKIKNDISLNVAGAYLQVLFAEEQLNIAVNQSEITKKQVENTKKLLDAGSVAKGSLLDIQAQLASEEMTVASAQNQVDLSYLSLAQLMNLPSAGGFKVTKPEISLPAEVLLTGTPEQIFTQAVTALPEIKSAELKVQSAEKGLAVAKGGMSPRLTFSASIGTGYSGASQKLTGYSLSGYDTIGVTTLGDAVLSPSFTPSYINKSYSDQYKDNINKTLGFRLTIPIFNNLQTHTAISRAKINRQSAELTLEQTKQQLNKSIQQAYADANAALKKYYATQKAVTAMEESFKYTDQRYTIGMMNAIDYNTAKNRLVKTKSDLLQAKYDFVFKSKVLDFYQGKPLTL